MDGLFCCFPEQSQMMPGQGFADYSQGGAVYAHLHDPRHQKLMMEHQRSSSSPIPLQSPSHSSKQVSALCGELHCMCDAACILRECRWKSTVSSIPGGMFLLHVMEKW